jgi:hypothetical protein
LAEPWRHHEGDKQPGAARESWAREP